MIANIYTPEAPLWTGREWLFSQARVCCSSVPLMDTSGWDNQQRWSGFVCDKCEGEAGEALEMESWALEGWELDHIKPLRVRVDTFCPWQFNICYVFPYICWVTFFSMNSTDEECSWTGRDFPGKGPPFQTDFNFYYWVVAMIFDLEAKECVLFCF